MVGLTLFGLVVFGLFAAFSHSTRSFQHAVLRQGLQGESLRFSNILGRDNRLTNYHSTHVVPRLFTKSGGLVVSRDGFAVAALSDWDDNSKFDTVTGLPIWDRHTVYYATDDADSGRLIRQSIDPGGPTNGDPFFALDSNLQSQPNLNTGVLNTQQLSSNVESFSATADDGSEALVVSLVLRRKGGVKRTSAGRRTDETLESQITLTARNTFPRL